MFGNEPVISKNKDDKQTEETQHPLLLLGNVSLGIYTGHFTRDESSGIDVMIVGNINQAKLNKFILDLERDEGKEIRYVVMPGQEFEYRRQIKDRFINDVLAAKKQVIVDKD